MIVRLAGNHLVLTEAKYREKDEERQESDS